MSSMKRCVKTLGFSGNPENYKPLAGHPGYDEHCGFGTPVHWPIVNADRMWVYKIINDKQPAFDGSGYWAVFAIVERQGQFFEFHVGHLSRIDVKEGDALEPGQVIGLEGNRGYVFENGVRITLEMQRRGDRRGSHRHYQKRPVVRIAGDTYSGSFLMAYDPSGPQRYVDPQGFRYVTPLKQFRNGFNGCVDCSDEIIRFKEWFATNKNAALENIFEPTDTPEVIEQKRNLAQTLLSYLQRALTALRGR